MWSFYNKSGQTVLLIVSISVAFIEFCGIVVWNLIPLKANQFLRKSVNNGDSHDQVLLDMPQSFENSDQHSHNEEEQHMHSHYYDSYNTDSEVI